MTRSTGHPGPARRAAARTSRRARSFARYGLGLRRFLRTPMSGELASARIRRQLEQREASFGDVVRRGVFGNRSSPYLPLFRRAGIEPGDVDDLLRERGLDETLGVLYDAGVTMRLEEFKGTAPVERGALRYEVTAEQFDNPLLDPVWAARTGGSTGNARSVQLDFGVSEAEAAYVWLFLEVHGVHGLPQGMWRPVPPGSSGLGNALSLNKIGVPVARWFTQTWPGGGIDGLTERAFIRYTLAACRRWGPGIDELRHVPLDEPREVAVWLGEMARAGTPAMLNAPASSAVRAAQAAADLGLDLTGSLLRTGGEPLTDAKAAAIAATGARVVCNYAMTEAGRMGVGCAAPSATDDVHLLTDKLGVIQRDQEVALTGATVPALLMSSLRPACRKIMINVEIGDYGTLEERSCGCAAGDLGLTLHLHGIRSHDKLTSGGMSFLGSEVVTLVEDVLPRRFGGGVGDYQLVESEVGGLPSIAVVIRPEVGPLDEAEVVGAVLDTFRAGPSYKQMMTTFLADGRTVRVERQAPYATPAAKVLPLHIVRS